MPPLFSGVAGFPLFCWDGVAIAPVHSAGLSRGPLTARAFGAGFDSAAAVMPKECGKPEEKALLKAAEGDNQFITYICR